MRSSEGSVIVWPQHIRDVGAPPNPPPPLTVITHDHRGKRAELDETNGRCGETGLEEVGKVTHRGESDFAVLCSGRKHRLRKQEVRGVLVGPALRVVVCPLACEYSFRDAHPRRLWRDLDRPPLDRNPPRGVRARQRPIPEGLFCLHRCVAKGRGNVVTAIAVSVAARRTQTQCKRGHSLDDAYLSSKGQRKGRVCTRERDARRGQKRKNLASVEQLAAEPR